MEQVNKKLFDELLRDFVGLDEKYIQLQAKNKRLKEILKPFAEFNTLVDITRNETTLTFQDFMKAKQALKDKQ